jgi:hypothetical protein
LSGANVSSTWPFNKRLYIGVIITHIFYMQLFLLIT